MKHRGIKIESFGERELGEARAAEKCPPVGEGRDSLPAVLKRERGHVHPITGRSRAIFSALLIHFWVEVITR